MSRTLSAIFQPQDVRSMRLIPLHIVMGVRLAVIWTQAGRDALPALATRLNSMEAARTIMALVHHMDRAWPERFMVSRPCRPAMTPDETLLGACAGAVEQLRFDLAESEMRGFIHMDLQDELLRHLARTVAAVREALSTGTSFGQIAPVDAPQRQA